MGLHVGPAQEGPWLGAGDGSCCGISGAVADGPWGLTWAPGLWLTANAARSCKHRSGKATTCVWQEGVHFWGHFRDNITKKKQSIGPHPHPHPMPRPSCWEPLPALWTWNLLFAPSLSAVPDVARCSTVSPARTTVLPVSHKAASPLFTDPFPVVTGMLTVNRQHGLM